MSEIPVSFNKKPQPTARRGQFMDFAPRGRQAARPAEPPSTIPMPLPPELPSVEANYATEKTTVLYPHATVQRTATRATLTPVQPPARAAQPPVQARPVAQPQVAPRPAPARRSYDEFQDDYLDLEDATLGIIEDADGNPAPEPDSPDNARFIFGGRSPFINTDKVPKRPLGPAKKATLDEVNARAAKNTYAKRSTPVVKDKVPTVIVDGGKKASSLPLIIAIILTVILGAVVGAVVYLAFFQ